MVVSYVFSSKQEAAGQQTGAGAVLPPAGNSPEVLKPCPGFVRVRLCPRKVGFTVEAT